jgi:hypothetical protein
MLGITIDVAAAAASPTNATKAKIANNVVFMLAKTL